MTSAIWKSPLYANNVVEFPEGARILDVQVQRGVPTAWALVDKSKPVRQIHLDVYGTGHPVPDDPGEHVATFQMDGGAPVFHVFRKGAA